MKSGIIMLTVSLLASSALADDVVLKSEAALDAHISRAEVWMAPKWISKDFKFAESFKFAQGPELSGADKALTKDDVYCLRTEGDIDLGDTGKTAKFTCRLLANDGKSGELDLVTNAKGKTAKYKFKYGAKNPEIFGEMIATRLLWALGFAADKMYLVERTHCYGCTSDPFRDTEINQATMRVAQLFENTAAEVKFGGDSIVYKHQGSTTRPSGQPRAHSAPPVHVRQRPQEGWVFSDLMKLTSSDPAEKRKQLIERDALRLMTIFLQHGDNKAENQRLACLGETDKDGNCKGRVVALLQDVGATMGKGFGARAKFPIGYVSKVEMDEWAGKKLWKNPSKCEAFLGISGQRSIMHPRISEEGRQMLVKLFDGFMAGAQGEQRMRALFEEAKVELYDGTIDGWVQGFKNKVEQMKYPMGRENPNFKCPLSF